MIRIDQRMFIYMYIRPKIYDNNNQDKYEIKTMFLFEHVLQAVCGENDMINRHGRKFGRRKITCWYGTW